MRDILARIEASARDLGLFRRSRSVLAAVSGGPDSVALLLALERISASAGFALTVAHFDHKLRPDSAEDLAFVREVCAARGVAFLSGEGDVRDVAKRQRLGIEETARRMRYQFLGFVAGEKGIDAIATGHTADDQAETVLMRVLRGSGVRGIRGMRPVSTIPGGSQKLVRPLLGVTRVETEAICAAVGIEPRRDATNDDTAALRNRLRHEVLPLLRTVNPSVDAALRRLAENASEVFERVEREAMAVLPAERGPVGAIFQAGALRPLGGEALELVIEREAAFYRLEVETNATRLRNLRAVLAKGAGSARFGACEVEVSCGRVRIGPPLETAEVPEKVLNVPGTTVAGQWRVDVSTDPLPGQPGAVSATVPMDGLTGALRVRALKAGDRMRFHGLERTVADVLAGRKVPRWEREGAIALADSARVLAILTASGNFEADRPDGADVLHVRVAALPPKP